jgi:hypothetical protein
MAHEAQFLTETPPENRSEPLDKTVQFRPSDEQLKIQAAAMQLFLQYKTPESIAEELQIPTKTVKDWVKSRSWTDKRVALEKHAEEVAGANYRNFVRENRLTTAQRHLETATILEHTIKRAVENEYRATTERLGDRPVTKEQAQIFKTLAEALSQVTTVSARAVGLRENDARSPGEDNTAQGRKAPLVILNLGKQTREPKTVDVDTE